MDRRGLDGTWNFSILQNHLVGLCWYTCRYTVSSPVSVSPGSGYSILAVSLNPAADISSKNTSSLECRIFIAIATKTLGDILANRVSVLTSAGLPYGQSKHGTISKDV